MARISITLMLTLLDDAYYLPEWAECARRLEPDEVLVIDGGSKDDGPKFLESQNLPGFRLVRRPMEEIDWHYSNQLNFATGHARGDWILLYDADEVIWPPERRLLEQAVDEAEDEIVSLWLPRHDLWPDEQTRVFRGSYVDPQPRFWRRDSGIQWYRKVHNQQVYKGQILGYEHWAARLLEAPALLHRKHLAPKELRLARHERWLEHWAEASADAGITIPEEMPEEFGPTEPLPAEMAGWRDVSPGVEKAQVEMG